MSWGQLATAFACRSETRWVARLAWRGNPPLLAAVATEIMILFMFIGVRPAADLLGGGFPPATGWLTAAAVIPAVIAADAAHKALHTRPQARRTATISQVPAGSRTWPGRSG